MAVFSCVGNIHIEQGERTLITPSSERVFVAFSRNPPSTVPTPSISTDCGLAVLSDAQYVCDCEERIDATTIIPCGTRAGVCRPATRLRNAASRWHNFVRSHTAIATPSASPARTHEATTPTNVASNLSFGDCNSAFDATLLATLTAPFRCPNSLRGRLPGGTDRLGAASSGCGGSQTTIE